jgi:hypothetical protein
MEPLRFRTNFFDHFSSYILIKKVYAHFMFSAGNENIILLNDLPLSIDIYQSNKMNDFQSLITRCSCRRILRPGKTSSVSGVRKY